MRPKLLFDPYFYSFISCERDFDNIVAHYRIVGGKTLNKKYQEISLLIYYMLLNCNFAKIKKKKVH